MTISLELCRDGDQPDKCVDKDTEKKFFDDYFFVAASANNYIDMEEINSVEESIKYTTDVIYWDFIDIKKNYTTNYFLEEYRFEMQDDFINFMDLSERKSIKFLNVAAEDRRELWPPSNGFELKF